MVLVVVAVVTLPAAVMLARYQARRTVWEQEIQDAGRTLSSRAGNWWPSSAHDLRTPLAGIRAL